MSNHISDRINQVREKIASACRRAGRREEEITLIAVTKTWPPEVVAAASAAGLTDFGENKAQELVAKAPLFPTQNWHMIGHLQRNKARQVVAYAKEFHALDSIRLARALNRHAEEAGRILSCFIQVNVSGEASKFGLNTAQVVELATQLGEYEALQPIGLMTLASPDLRKVREEFRLLRSIRSKYSHLTGAGLSMGMSGDYEIAIEEGATHIRVGSALFGPRKPIIKT
ncbi:MAG: YggS family pyridoxal phosphate-dependent enzyme [Rhodothermaceae bacterium]|nr:YggS family pyridoxal phosphate-dependent enzyme [Rhodothermaceae bacterium]MXW33923.1 YggS family pyridoxal phosphate-dependent enzyme [Rhodothermaceae bacterium]MYC04082.1 YggS family pyridoxal phosphate-dependent enzyme [Rhodothermaceae bacterium]MYE61807.1 YggS family pyridoxal phosphate-dependent enzyme [Rhodothermaceae bacterium]MYI16032.1 YggS family pyridoxal phosphate-dependent enzyme [Rhodothermaceae bacterium]